MAIFDTILDLLFQVKLSREKRGLWTFFRCSSTLCPPKYGEISQVVKSQIF